MGKFNTKASAVVAPTTTNEMGEKAYVLSAKEELVSTILTTFLQSSYYEKEEEIVERIISAANRCDPLFVAKAAVYARREANMRSVTHLLAGELASRASGKEWATRFFRKILVRPDDMAEILAYIKYKNAKKGDKLKISNPIKRAFKAYLESMDPYLVDKYKMRGKDFSLKGLMRLFHPKASDTNTLAFKALMEGSSLEGLYTSKILEKELSSAGQQAKQEGVSKEDLQAYKGDAIKDVLTSDKGMPIMNLLRNLRNILENAPDMVEEACSQLTDKKRIVNSRLLPFRFMSAYQEIEKLKPTMKGSSIQFEKAAESNANKVLNALEIAIGYSVANIPKLDGNTAILIDHSGSMSGDGGGSSKVSALSKVTTSNIADLFGSMMLYAQDNCYLGLFGDRLIDVQIDRSKGPLEFTRDIHMTGNQCGGATEAGIYEFLRRCVKNKIRVDNLIVFSDMVIGEGGTATWYGTSYADRGPSFQNLFAEFRKVNPQCNVISVDLKQTSGKSVFHKSMRLTQVAGWSDKIFDVISSSAKGYDELIKEIETIKI